MSLGHKRIEDVKESNLRELVNGSVSEGKTIEYKLTLPGASDSDKKEFLADISSFANASGGDIVYGIKEDKGIAVELVGLVSTDLDAEKLRLEEIIRNGIDLRIPGLTIHARPYRDDEYGACHSRSSQLRAASYGDIQG
jgi:predicted HTH transcriptional regulator